MWRCRQVLPKILNLSHLNWVVDQYYLYRPDLLPIYRAPLTFIKYL